MVASWLKAIFVIGAVMTGASAQAATPETILTINPIVLHDRAQNKDTALRITLPVKGGRLPIILFSHGAQYSKDDYLPLTEFWAQHGYVVIQPTHIESTSLGLAHDDPRVKNSWKSRLLDMHHILDSFDEIERLAPQLKGRLDRKNIIAAGHSFGGHTTAALTAATMPDEKTDLSDPRIKAAIMLAPPGAAPGFRNVAWPNKPKPMLNIVGLLDTMKGFNDDWRQHAEYYYKGPPGQCLAAMAGMKHYLGGILGEHRTEDETPSPESLAEIQRMTLAFLNTEAKGTNDWPKLRDELLKSKPAIIGLFECK